MKLMNYSPEALIAEHMRVVPQESESMTPRERTPRQYQILCHLIREKKITKEFFSYIVSGLFGTEDWKALDYSQTYQLIHVL
ncbi:MAG: hypothetical protein NC548_60635, partial [Lachnospiraceae bacterium]|nr:hypothetical protein [Lachnospiraceae bacterium]